VAALLLVSPLFRGVRVPAFMALVNHLLSAQAVYGRKTVWLRSSCLRPRSEIFGLQFGVSCASLAAFFDLHSASASVPDHGPDARLTCYLRGFMPSRGVAGIRTLRLSLGGGTVALFAFGLLRRDGPSMCCPAYLMILIHVR